MDIFPAIDIQAGRVVRAGRSNPHAVTVYHEDPLAVADAFVAAGAQWLHVVDLDRAFGTGDQSALVGQLVRRVPIAVQSGGGIWATDDVMMMRDLGVQRVVLGARAAADAGELEALLDCFSGDSLALAVDAKDGKAWSRDWAEAPKHAPADLARRAREAGINTVVYTDLATEGALAGANIADATALAQAAGVDVVLSGGVTSIEELRAIKAAGLAGAVVGRALYDRKFTLEAALACC